MRVYTDTSWETQLYISKIEKKVNSLFFFETSTVKWVKFCSRICYKIDWVKRIPGWNKGLKRTWQSLTEFKKGHGLKEENVNWKGDKVGYHALHSWVNRKLGKPNKCEICGTETAKNYEWANKNHKYKRDLNDWIRLCRFCHRKFDKQYNLVDNNRI